MKHCGGPNLRQLQCISIYVLISMNILHTAIGKTVVCAKHRRSLPDTRGPVNGICVYEHGNCVVVICVLFVRFFYTTFLNVIRIVQSLLIL
jgi:hypothetical protein